MNRYFPLAYDKDKAMTLPEVYDGMKYTNSLRNIIMGIGSVVDLFGTQSLSQRGDFINADNEWSDCDALKSDWLAIGNDMSQVIVGADMPEAEELFKKYYKRKQKDHQE